MSTDVAAQVRRRRAAAQRLPAMNDGTGRSDPLDPCPTRSIRPAGVTYDTGRDLVLVRGHKAGSLLRSYGLKPLYSSAGRGHVVDGHHCSDVVAFLEHDGFFVTYREV
jgi:hypothetical protein